MTFQPSDLDGPQVALGAAKDKVQQAQADEAEVARLVEEKR